MQEEADLLSVGRWVFLQSVASTLKCFSLQHICPKWSLIAHWRMHDIKCLQTWNNHVLSLLEIVCSGFVFTTMLNKTEVLTNHIRRVSHSLLFLFNHANCVSVRDYIYFVGTSVYVTVLLHKNSCFPCAVKMHWNRS